MYHLVQSTAFLFVPFSYKTPLLQVNDFLWLTQDSGIGLFHASFEQLKLDTLYVVSTSSLCLIFSHDSLHGNTQSNLQLGLPLSS
jgi:hypothetical protein